MVTTVWSACPTRADFSQEDEMKGRTASNSLPPTSVLQITDNQRRKFCSRIDDVVRLRTGTLPVIWRELEIAYDLMVSGVSFTINKYRKYTPDNCCQIPGVISQRAPSEFGILGQRGLTYWKLQADKYQGLSESELQYAEDIQLAMWGLGQSVNE